MSKVYRNAGSTNRMDKTLRDMSSPKGTLSKSSRLKDNQTLRATSAKNSGRMQSKDLAATGKENFYGNSQNLTKTKTLRGADITGRTQVLDPVDTTSKMMVIESKMNRPDLLKLFDKFGIFPNKHRALIWKHLLGLPMNQEAFEGLLAQGIHIAFQDLEKTFSIPAKDLQLKLQRILSCLAHFSPVFSEVEYLPDLVYPFVKLFAAGDELICFEIIVAFFFQWGQHFFEFFPNPPVSVMQGAEEILKFHEYELYSHFKKLNLSMVDYCWPFLKSLFTTVLARDDWLSLMDFLVLYSREPVYLVYFMVAYLAYFKDPLLRVETQEDITSFLEKQNAINIQTIIRDMRFYKKNTPPSGIPVKFINYLPFEGERYPFFSLYPEYAVEYHRKIREQFLAEEKKLDFKKESIKHMQNLTDDLLDQERKFRDKQEALVKAQNDRKTYLMREEERRLKIKLNAETEARETRIAQLLNIEKSLQASLEQQDRLAKEELESLQRELEVQSRVDRQLIQSRLEEEALLSTEFQAAQRLHEIGELRNTEERNRKIRTEIDYVQRQNKMKDRIWEDNLRAEDEEFKLRMDALRQKKLAELNLQKDINDKKELDLELLNENLKKELKHQDVDRERKMRTIAQEGVVENEEYFRLRKQREEAIRVENEKYIKTMMDEENRKATRRFDERLNQIEQEKRNLRNDLENYEQTLKDKTLNQKNDDFENRMFAVRKEKELRLLEEESELQKVAMNIEEQRRIQREMQKEMFHKEKEYQDKLHAYRSLRSNDEKMLNEERMKFTNYREAFRDELDKIEQVRGKMAEARISQIQKQNEERVYQKTEDLRKKVQTENMMRYFEGEKRPEEEESESESSESSLREEEQDQGSYQSRPHEYRTEDSRRRGHESQRTGAFQSQEESADKYGRSISSYTYSDMGTEDYNNRSKTGVSEAQNIISRHQYMRSMDEPDSRYYRGQYQDSRAPREPYTSNSGGEEYTSEGESRRYYQGSRDDMTRSQQLQSSPDNNLTYSSYEGSIHH